MRMPWITADIELRLYPLLGGIAGDLGCTPIAINGMPEHVHVLVRFPSDLAVADLLRHLKSRSSKWIHESFASAGDFSWQQGYGGFTVGKPSVAAIEHYIRSQKEHHKTLSFESEYVSRLRKTGCTEAAEDIFR